MDYVYQIGVLTSDDIAEGFLALPDIVGIFGEDEFSFVKSIIEHNAADIYESCFDYVIVDKVPLNTLYFRTYIEERFIFKYGGFNNYHLIDSAIGLEEINRMMEKYSQKNK